MSVETVYEDGELMSVVIDDEEYEVEEDRIVIPIPVLIKQKLSDFPKGCTLEICDSQSKEIVFCHNVPTTIQIMDDGVFEVTFDETTTRKYWDGPISLKLYMETKRDVITEREKAVGDIRVENFDDDGAYISLTYTAHLNAASFDELIVLVDQVYNELEGATDIALGSPFAKLEDCEKESSFTTKILLPLFRQLGFANVKYTHGNKEFGKDITFARRTEFDDLEFYGCQVKFGHISGSATGEVNELIAQAKDAFQMPFYDVYTRQKVRISKLVIAVSGKFTSNAIEKIVEGLTDYPLKNNLIFIDGEKINTLLARYRRF